MSKKLSHYRTQKTAVCLMSVMDDRSNSINCNSIMFTRNILKTDVIINIVFINFIIYRLIF